MSDQTPAEQYADRVAAGLATVAQVDPERREQRGVAGDWSLKDLLGHLAYWDSVTCAKLEAEAAGREFQPDPREDDPINAEQAGARSAWTWNQVMDELLATRDRLVELLQRPSRLDLTEIGGHWVEHRQDIEAWLKHNQPIDGGIRQ